MTQDFNELRTKALEALSLKHKNDVNEANLGSDVKKLLEELSVHQIELEYQNEELIRAQDAIRKQSNEFADLFDNAPVGYLIIDANHNIVKSNRTFGEMLHMQPYELIGNPIEKYISPLFQDNFYHFMKLLTQNGMGAQVNVKIRSNFRGDTFVRIDGKILNDDTNYIRLSIVDITEQKQLEDLLRKETEKVLKSEVRFRQIVEQSTDTFVYLNVHPISLDYLSPTIERLTGYTVDECLNMSANEWYGILLPQYRDGATNLFERLLKAELSQEKYIYSTFEIRCKNGEIKWVHGSFSLNKNFEEVPYQIIGTFHDITSNIDYQTQLKLAKEKAEENDSLKSAYLANMSHEIRTPLNAIIGFANILSEGFKESGDEENLNFVSIIERNGERLLELINDLICISKIESNQMTLSFSEFNLNQLMVDINDMFRLDAIEKGLALKCINDNTPIIITSDKDKLTSCCCNLIKNALKYTNEGYVEYCASVCDDKLNFYVKDSGIGVQDNKKESIFNRFAQVNSTSSKDGIGLGLSIVKGLIDLLNGTITIESEFGKGSTFSFSIPLKQNGTNI